MPIPTDISRGELLVLITDYDKYIQQANDENRYHSGWRPVCIAEFYEMDHKPPRYDVELLVAWSRGEDYGQWSVIKFEVELDEPFSMEALRRAAEKKLKESPHEEYVATTVYSFDFAEEDDNANVYG